MKLCYTCQEEKPLSEFNKKDGTRLQSKCRVCQKAWYNNYYNSNPKEKIRLRGNRQKSRFDFREFLIKEKDKPCMDCNLKFPSCAMDFDHRPCEVKMYNVGNMGLLGMKVIIEEIKKCDLVCANCHRVRTSNRRILGGGLSASHVDSESTPRRFDSCPPSANPMEVN